MQTQFQLIFEPVNSHQKVVIMQKTDATLQSLRDESLSQYLFLNKEGVTIQTKYQSKYTIQNIVNDKNQITLRKKGFIKASNNKEESQSSQFEFYLNFDGENKKILIKATENTNLDQISKKNLQLQGYLFINKNGQFIKPEYFKNYTVAEVINEKKVTVRKKQSQKKSLQKTFSIIFKNSKRQKIQIVASQSDTLNNIRKEDSLSNYVFLNKNGTQISKNSQNKVKIADLAINNTILMSPINKKVENEMSEEKRKKIIQQQKQRLASINESIKEIESFKTGNSKQENQKRMDEIANKLKQKYNLLIPEKLEGIHELSSIISRLEGQKAQCSSIIQFAKKEVYSEAQMFQRNGGILPTAYMTHKKENQTVIIVDFDKTPKLSYNKYKKNYKYSVIQYQVTQQSSATVKLSKKSDYEFNGGQLKFSAYSISGKVSGGKAQLQQTDCLSTKKSVKKGQKLHQLFLSFATNQVIYFEKDKIALKKEVIENFQHIVQKFMDQKDDNKLRENVNKYFDKYGIGIKSSLYYLGGVYKNVIKYSFNTNIESQELSDILRKQSEKKASGGIGGSSIVYSAEATFQHQDKGIGESSTGSNKLSKKSSYQSSFYHEAQPLSSIKDIDKWTETIQSFPHNWALVGYQDPTTVLITELLSSKDNSIKMENQFIQAKKKVIQLMNSILKCLPFIFEFEQNSKYFINGTTIKKGGEQHKQYQIIGKTGLPMNKVSFYTVQIVNSKMMNIAIGICSNTCKGNEYSSPKKDNVIYYKIEGKGKIETKKQQIRTNCIIKNKSIIKIIVDTRQQGSIAWEVNGKCIHKIQIPVQIMQGGIYPYFHMLNNGDTIKIN